MPAVGAVTAGGLVDLVLAHRPQLLAAVLGGLVPGLVWAGQLGGLAGSGMLRWPVELWAGVVVLVVLLSLALAWLTSAARYRGPAAARAATPQTA